MRVGRPPVQIITMSFVARTAKVRVAAGPGTPFQNPPVRNLDQAVIDGVKHFAAGILLKRIPACLVSK